MTIALWAIGAVGVLLLLTWRLRLAAAKVQAILDELPGTDLVLDHHHDDADDEQEAVGTAAWPHPPRRLWVDH